MTMMQRYVMQRYEEAAPPQHFIAPISMVSMVNMVHIAELLVRPSPSVLGLRPFPSSRFSTGVGQPIGEVRWKVGKDPKSERETERKIRVRSLFRSIR